MFLIRSFGKGFLRQRIFVNFNDFPIIQSKFFDDSVNSENFSPLKIENIHRNSNFRLKRMHINQKTSIIYLQNLFVSSKNQQKIHQKINFHNKFQHSPTLMAFRNLRCCVLWNQKFPHQFFFQVFSAFSSWFSSSLKFNSNNTQPINWNSA